jgi:hypothetical protein
MRARKERNALVPILWSGFPRKSNLRSIANSASAKDVVLAYLDYSKVFKIYTDASSKQLGAVITQDNRPIVFFSWKLSDLSANTASPKLNY